MSEVDTDTGISLADLADLDVSEVTEIRFSQLPAGVFDFKVVEADIDEGLNRDQLKRFWAAFKFEVVEAIQLIDKGVTKDELVGRNHSEKLYIVPEKAEEGIGLIRAFIADMELDNSGKLGDIVKGSVGHIFRAKIVSQKDRSDPSISYARLKLDPPKRK